MPVPKIPEGVIVARKRICEACPTPCEPHQAGRIAHEDPCERCPLAQPRWAVYGRCRNFGLGDAVAVVAQPIARVIDAVAGTNLKECGGCAKRRAALNAMVPKL